MHARYGNMVIVPIAEAFLTVAASALQDSRRPSNSLLLLQLWLPEGLAKHGTTSAF